MRHGETAWNRDFRYQGRSDVPLSEAGREQASRVGIRLASTAPSRVFSSPLSRALETAEIIMEKNSSGAPIETLDSMREMSFGVWEGLTMSEIKARDPETLARWWESPFSCAPEGGETFPDLLSRAREAASAVTAASVPGEPVLVVAHGVIIRALIAIILNIGEAEATWRMRFDNCSVTVLDIWGRHPSMLLLNDTHHLRLAPEDIHLLSFPEF